VLLVNSSGGKDSQTALAETVRRAKAAGVPSSKIVVVHADLGRVEWKGTRALAEKQAKHYGLRFIVVSRQKGDILDEAEHERKMWPGPQYRWCTSDHKRSQIDKVMTALTDELFRAGALTTRSGERRPIRILNILGLRADESPKRLHQPQLLKLGRACNGRKDIDEWLPIKWWSADDVWRAIKASGVPYHRAYDLGMPRLSCCFCIFSGRDALLLAGKHNPELLDEYVRVEKKIGHSFQMQGKKHLPILGIKQALEAGEKPDPSKIATWCEP
jgi:3'-phosphoadenosine 5'-phosphosulfate sulfotransferase (PAPS reductase)/FAD synthetase